MKGVDDVAEMIDDVLPSLTIKFPSTVGKLYRIDWAETDTPASWNWAKMVVAEDTVTYWADTGAGDRKPTCNPTGRYYRVREWGF